MFGSEKAFSGCVICGASPGNKHKNAAKLFQCMACQAYACNQHVRNHKFAASKIQRCCPSCGATRMMQAAAPRSGKGGRGDPDFDPRESPKGAGLLSAGKGQEKTPTALGSAISLLAEEMAGIGMDVLKALREASINMPQQSAAESLTAKGFAIGQDEPAEVNAEGVYIEEEEEGAETHSVKMYTTYYEPTTPSGFDKFFNILKSFDDPDLAEVVCAFSLHHGEAWLRKMLREGERALTLHHAFGVAPGNVEEFQHVESDWLQKLQFLLQNTPKTVGVGPTGLDYSLADTPTAYLSQNHAFMLHLALAERLKLPVFVTCVEAEMPIVDTLNAFVSAGNLLPPAIIITSGITDRQAQRALEALGCYFTLLPALTYPEAEPNYRELLKEIPQDRLLLAAGTDIQPPLAFAGQWNTPIYTPNTLEVAAILLDKPLDDLRKILKENHERVFGIAGKPRDIPAE